MQVKRLCGLLLGVLLVLGISSSATGQITAGITIRVDRPDSGKVVAIGDSIVVRLINTLTSVPDSVFVRIVQAASATSITDSTVIAAQFSEKAVDTTPSGGSPTFYASFIVAAGDPEKATLLAAVATVYSGGVATQFSNLNTTNTVAVDPGKGKVGDGKTFGVDGQRPTIANIDTVYLDANIRPVVTVPVNDGSGNLTNRGWIPRQLTNTGSASAGTGRFGFKNGEVMGVNVVVKAAIINDVAAGALRGVVVFVDTAGATRTNARVVVEFLAADLLSSTITKSVGDTTSAGQISTVTVAKRFPTSSIARKTVTLTGTITINDPINALIKATIEDVSTNIAGVTATSTTEADIVGGVPASKGGYLVKQGATKITAVYPATTNRFTGVKSYLYNVINSGGTALESKRFGARPISWTLSDVVDSFTVAITKDAATRTWTRGAGTAIQATGTDSLNVNDTATGTITAPGLAGSAVDVALTATDSVGNTTSVAVTGAFFDSTRIAFGSRFPRAIQGSNKDTFNAATSPLVFTLSEAADSILLVYRKLGVSSGSVSTARGAGGGNINVNLTSTASQKVDIDSDSLSDQSFYGLQLFGRDPAYNWTVTEPPDTLFYNVGFQAAQADSIRVVVSAGNDTVVANTSGTGVTLQIAGWDSILLASAPDYKPNGVLVTAWSPDSTLDLTGVHITGTGVTEQAALIAGGKKRATLDNQWILGSRTIVVSDSLNQSPIFVNVTDTISTVNKSGETVGLAYEAGQMTQYRLFVSAADTTEKVAGASFLVQVQPQDQFGNPSLKQADLIYTDANGGNALKVLYVEFSSNYQGAGVPQGPQRINSTAWTPFEFRAPAANAVTVITARNANIEGVTAIGHIQRDAIGTLYIKTTGGTGEPLPTGDPTVMKPDTLVVENYEGADGAGDQGGFVLATWPNTSQHGQLSAYRIWRFIQVNHGLDSLGTLAELAVSAGEWVPWAKVDAVPPILGTQGVSRAVVPTLDNQATKWAITAEMGGKPSDATLSIGKVVYSAESVKQTLALLGIRSVLPAEEVLNIFGPSYEYRTSILGDRKDLLLGVLDLDGLRKTAMRLPEGIRAQVAQVRASGATLAAGTAAGTDDLPPAAVSGEEATTDDREVTLTWEVSADDRIVGVIPYRGYITPIPGVRTYEILRGSDADNLVGIASLPAGSGSFAEVIPAEDGDVFVYRINATDLDNITVGPTVSVNLEGVVSPSGGRIQYFTAGDVQVFLMLSEDNPSFNLESDFDDFFEFAGNFGQDESLGIPVLNLQADTDDDGDVDFDDFFAFAGSFGLEAEAPSTKAAGKVAVQMPIFGANREVGLELKLTSARVLPGEPIQVDVTVSGAVDLSGYGFTLTYDAQKFELVEVTPGDDNLLTQGGVTPVFLKVIEPGKVQVANAISGEGSVAGSGTVAQLVFNVKGDFEDAVRFELDNGILIDGDRLLNPVLTLDVLEIQTTPTEFALRQNYPNPFNPATTIKFDLAESGQVDLRIYNMVGQVVRTLVDENQAAGRYSIRWDGRDDRGLTVSSGIYFYSLRADKFRAVKKLMLLK